MTIKTVSVIESERCYLGSVLTAVYNNNQTPDMRKLKPDDFESKKYGLIYKTILKQIDEGITPTILTLHDALKGDDAISAYDIADLDRALPSAANLSYYENIVYKESQTRLIKKAGQTFNDRLAAGENPRVAINDFVAALNSVNVARNEEGISTAAELLNMEFPAVKWIVPGLIGEGLTMINGAPKIGKSWLMLNLAVAAASGGGFLGKLKAEKTGTLYLALEDTQRRLHNRLKIINSPRVENLFIATQWRGGYIGLEAYLKAAPHIGLAIVDTLARFADIEDMNDYAMTTNSMARLKRIADELKIAILVVHHTRKGGADGDWTEAALGSQGLTGTTDTTIFLDRPRSKKNGEKQEKNTAALYATGRDAADVKYNLKYDLDIGSWAIAENIEQEKKSHEKPKSLTLEMVRAKGKL